ncbi:MAG: glucosamine--fructose-6-phosphate aminotransferase [Actinomycetota bacterium]|nr:MAG: glucosamine--fructose-6-phosphate aminotransferase [Actinomycetota bacterium]
MRSLGNFPDPFLAEIAEQPDAIRRAAAALLDQRDLLERVREVGRTARTLVFTGMGSSYDACYPAVNDLAGRGVASLLVDTAELLHFRRPILDAQTLLVMVSQSGASAEIVKLANEIAKQRVRPFVMSVTNGLDNDLARRADIRLDTWAGVETGPSTKTFAAAMTTLSGLARLLAGDSVATAIDHTRTAAEGAALAAERLLDDPEAEAERLAGLLGGREVMVVLGRGPARAAAEMGALILKECGIMAESLESAMFRHGPLELAGPGMSAIVLATEPETRRLDLALAAELVEAGAAVLVVTPDGEAPKGAHPLATGYLDRALMSAVAIVPIQLLAWKLAVLAGRTPGAYTRASKVTTRE